MTHCIHRIIKYINNLLYVYNSCDYYIIIMRFLELLEDTKIKTELYIVYDL